MPFDATLGATSANSYVSQDDADTYFAASRPAAASLWLGQTDADKQQALMGATARLDTLNWVGARLAAPTTQPLAWPRYGVFLDGWLVNTDQLPRGLLVATCELALAYLADPATDPEAYSGLEGLGEVKLGSLDVTLDDATVVRPGALPPVVRRALRGLTRTYAQTRVTR